MRTAAPATGAQERWRPLLTGPPAEEALAVARALGSRLRDPERLARASEFAPRQTSFPRLAAWRRSSLSQGHAGLAVAFAQLDACLPGDGWEIAAHRQLRLAVEGLQEEREAASGLFSGLAGLAFAVAFVDAERYGRLLATLERLLERRTRSLLAALSRAGGHASGEFDLVSGLTGIGTYFLTRSDVERARPILGGLVDLLRRDGWLPAWHTPPELLDRASRRRYPDGCLNCGLAHGLPGPLALLSLAQAAGSEVEGLPEAVEAASAWLLEHAFDDEWGLNWPAAVPLDHRAAPEPARAGWCYGAPGVARALWLAGAARRRRDLQETAVAALASVFRRPPEARRLPAPTFCHGSAGLLQIALRTASDAGSLRRDSERLAADIVAGFEPETLLGYRDVDPDGHEIDQAGLLTGTAGVLLVLLAAATPRVPSWDRLFLLS